MVSFFKRRGIQTILCFTAFHCRCVETRCRQAQSHDPGRVGAYSNIAADTLGTLDIYGLSLEGVLLILILASFSMNCRLSAPYGYFAIMQLNSIVSSEY